MNGWQGWVNPKWMSGRCPLLSGQLRNLRRLRFLSCPQVWISIAAKSPAVPYKQILMWLLCERRKIHWKITTRQRKFHQNLQERHVVQFHQYWCNSKYMSTSTMWIPHSWTCSNRDVIWTVSALKVVFDQKVVGFENLRENIYFTRKSFAWESQGAWRARPSQRPACCCTSAQTCRTWSEVNVNVCCSSAQNRNIWRLLNVKALADLLVIFNNRLLHLVPPLPPLLLKELVPGVGEHQVLLHQLQEVQV